MDQDWQVLSFFPELNRETSSTVTPRNVFFPVGHAIPLPSMALHLQMGVPHTDTNRACPRSHTHSPAAHLTQW